MLHHLCSFLAAAASLLLYCGALASASERATLQFATIARAGGCPLTLYFPVNNSQEAFLAPALCIGQDIESLQAAVACPRFDPVMNVTYLSLPIALTESSLLEEARAVLTPQVLQNRTLDFLQPVMSVRGLSRQPKMDLMLEPGRQAGLLRVACRNETCDLLRSQLTDGRWDELDGTEVELEATRPSWRSSEPPMIKLVQRISVANRSRILASSQTSASVLSAAECTNLRHRQILQINGTCGATVYKRSDRKASFVIEPTLCYVGDYEYIYEDDVVEQGGVIRLTLELRSERVKDRVTELLNRQSPLSVTFMSMVGAELRVSNVLTAWNFEALRLAADGNSAELPVRCYSQESCNRFISILRATPVNIWRHIRWSTESQIAGEAGCIWHNRAVFSYPMEEPDSCVAAGDIYQLEDNYWYAPTRSEEPKVTEEFGLNFETVQRGQRSYIVVQQRLNGDVDFSRDWIDYENGFGDNSSFWIGLRTLASLTSAGPAAVTNHRRRRIIDGTLRVELITWDSSRRHVVEYENFTVGPAVAGYPVSFGRMLAGSSTVVGDSLAASRGAKFSTRDADNDASPGWSCSRQHGGAGWWFGQAPCAFCNPNGVYGGPGDAGPTLAAWFHVSYRWAPLRETRLMLRLA